MNFVRTLFSAFATSIVTTTWKDNIFVKKQQLLSVITDSNLDLNILEYLVYAQSSTLAFNNIFQNITIAFIVVMLLVTVSLRVK